MMIKAVCAEGNPTRHHFGLVHISHHDTQPPLRSTCAIDHPSFFRQWIHRDVTELWFGRDESGRMAQGFGSVEFERGTFLRLV
jgi:hypothetical protein